MDWAVWKGHLAALLGGQVYGRLWRILIWRTLEGKMNLMDIAEDVGRSRRSGFGIAQANWSRGSRGASALTPFDLLAVLNRSLDTLTMDGILHGLNPAQRAAVTSSASVLQVLAPPGSGKTKTLTARVAFLIAHEQLKPWNIIVCTFTKKAANEMKERVRTFVGEELSKQIRLGTFHAIAVQYLRQYGQHIGLEKDFGIADA